MPRPSGAATLLLAAALVAACSGDEPAPGDTAAARSPSSSTAAPSTPAPSSPSSDASTEHVVGRPRVTGTVASNLAVPWGLAFLPDGSALVSERDTHRIRHVSADGTVTGVGRVRGVNGTAEGGLLGIAVSPDFAQDRQLYAYYTAGEENVVARMTYDGERLSGQRRILDGIPAGPIHNGGRIAFGPDGMLYVGTGESGRTELSQDRDSLGGKILRVTPDGDPAPDNPFDGSPVYSLGHRNVQGLAWDADGQLWAAEFGQNTWDELNRIEAGANYGWPEVEGRGRGDRFVDPERQWRTSVASPSGIAVADGAVYLAALRGERLWQVPLADGQTRRPRPAFTGRFGRLRTVAVAPDGSLWLTTSNRDGRGSPRDGDDRILRVTVG